MAVGLDGEVNVVGDPVERLGVKIDMGRPIDQERAPRMTDGEPLQDLIDIVMGISRILAPGVDQDEFSRPDPPPQRLEVGLEGGRISDVVGGQIEDDDRVPRPHVLIENPQSLGRALPETGVNVAVRIGLIDA